MLTKKQKPIFDYIKKYINKNDYGPSLQEIKQHFKLSSIATIHQHIENLSSEGYIKRIKNKPRSIELCKKQKATGLVSIPLLGTIAAGSPIEAIEDKETIAVPRTKISSSTSIFALRVQGNSMIDENINDGDIVLLKQQSVAENGQKIVALIDNSEATLKTFYKERGQIRLQPANKNYEPIIIKKNIPFAIQGIVVDVIKNKPTNIESLLASKSETTEVKELSLNKIICGDAVEELKKMPGNSIDLVITSPPYDEIRTYNGHNKFNLHATGKEIYRVLKNGGIAVMVIQDQTKNFGKTLTSFRTIADWCDNVGFKLFECVIYRKYGAEGAWWNKRFRVDHEYMPVFLKGERPQYFDKQPLKVPSKHGGKTMRGGGTRLTNGVRIDTRRITINLLKCRGTVWEYLTAGDGSRLKHLHPATFPNKLPYDFIQCFCPPSGIVLDPFVGSGTTTVAAKNLGRRYIGVDISKEYCEIAEKRMAEETNNQTKLV